jgi:hypothetical protein
MTMKTGARVLALSALTAVPLAKQRLNTRWRTLLTRQLCVTAHKIAVNVAPAHAFLFAGSCLPAAPQADSGDHYGQAQTAQHPPPWP